MPRPKVIKRKRIQKPRRPKPAAMLADAPSVDLGQIDKVVERRRFLLQLVRRGITQPDQIIEMYKKKDYDVSDRTIRDDRAAVRAVLRDGAKTDAEDARLEISAQFDDMAIQFQQITDSALKGDRKSYYAAVQSLGQKRDVLNAKAKLLGYIVEKTEHSGSVTNFNLNAEAGPADFAAIKHALKKAKIDDDGNPIPSSKSHEEGSEEK